MYSVIKWNRTSEVLPEENVVIVPDKRGVLHKVSVPRRVLVWWDGKVKPSAYFPKEERWEGHLKEQVPAYWAYVDELKHINDVDFEGGLRGFLKSMGLEG